MKTCKENLPMRLKQTHISNCFNESCLCDKPRRSSELKVLFWVSTLEYGCRTGPQFNLIKFISSTLYFASGLSLYVWIISVQLQDLGPHAFLMRNGFQQSHGKKKKKDSLMISTAAHCGRGKLRSARVWFMNSPLSCFVMVPLKVYKKKNINGRDFK